MCETMNALTIDDRGRAHVRDGITHCPASSPQRSSDECDSCRSTGDEKDNGTRSGGTHRCVSSNRGGCCLVVGFSATSISLKCVGGRALIRSQRNCSVAVLVRGVVREWNYASSVVTDDHRRFRTVWPLLSLVHAWAGVRNTVVRQPRFIPLERSGSVLVM